MEHGDYPADSSNQEKTCNQMLSEKNSREIEKSAAPMDPSLFAAQQETQKNAAIALKARGNEKFKLAEYQKAADLYSEALESCQMACFDDLKSVLHSNRAVCFSKLDLIDEAIADCSSAISFDPTYLKPLIRRAQLYDQKDLPEKALQDYEAVIQKEPQNFTAKCNILRLTPVVQDKNEKLKEEMISKLKDLGNVFLRPFGLSTDNFQLQPNESGGYSVKMQK